MWPHACARVLVFCPPVSEVYRWFASVFLVVRSRRCTLFVFLIGIVCGDLISDLDNPSIRTGSVLFQLTFSLIVGGANTNRTVRYSNISAPDIKSTTTKRGLFKTQTVQRFRTFPNTSVLYPETTSGTPWLVHTSRISVRRNDIKHPVNIRTKFPVLFERVLAEHRV